MPGNTGLLNSRIYRKNTDMKIIYSKTTGRNALYRALLAIIVGIVLIGWPQEALRYIIVCIGAIFLIMGIMAFITSYRRMQAEQRSDGLLSLNGIGSILLGILLVSVPLFFTAVLMIVLGCILILAAIAQLTTLAAMRQWGHLPAISNLFPILLLLAGLVIIFRPEKMANYSVVILGAASIFYGVTDLISQYQARKLRRQYEEKEGEQKMEQREDIEDAEYEEVEGGNQ